MTGNCTEKPDLQYNTAAHLLVERTNFNMTAAHHDATSNMIVLTNTPADIVVGYSLNNSLIAKLQPNNDNPPQLRKPRRRCNMEAVDDCRLQLVERSWRLVVPRLTQQSKRIMSLSGCIERIERTIETSTHIASASKQCLSPQSQKQH